MGGGPGGPLMCGELVGPWKFAGVVVKRFVFERDSIEDEAAVEVVWSVAAASRAMRTE